MINSNVKKVANMLVNTIIEVPLYQRYYAWEKQNWAAFYDDIVGFSNLLVKHEKENYFLGCIYLYRKEETTAEEVQEYLVIDGQQRLITFSLFLEAIHDILKEDDKEEFLNTKCYIESRSSKKMWLPSEIAARIKENFKLNGEDSTHFENIFDNHKIVTESKIQKSFNFFKENIRNEIKKKSIDITSIYQCLLETEAVFIFFDKHRPQQIFENINFKRKELTCVDLIRNYLIMESEKQKDVGLKADWFQTWRKLEKRFESEVKTIQSNQKWTKVLKSFMFHYLKYKNENSISATDNSIYWKFQEECGRDKDFGKNIESIMNEIIELSEYYFWIIKNEHKDRRIKKALFRLGQRSDQTVYYPYLFSVFRDFRRKVIDKKQLLAILELLESYCFRTVFVSDSPNTWSRFFAKLSKNVKAEYQNTKTYKQALASVLLKQTGKQEFLDDEELIKKIISKKYWKKEYATSFLKLIELEYGLSIDFLKSKDIQLEHIMPQTLTADWKRDLGKEATTIQNNYLNVIGNLTLLMISRNQKISNKSFREKKKEYVNDNKFPHINEVLINAKYWNEKTIKKRTEDLAYKACKMWPYPRIKAYKKIEKQIILVNDEKIIDLTVHDNFEFTYTDVNCLYLDNEKIEFKDNRNWTNALREICKFLYEWSPEKFMEIRKKKNILIFYLSKNPKENEELFPGILINVHWRTNHKIKALKKLTRELGYPQNKIKFKIISRKIK